MTAGQPTVVALRQAVEKRVAETNLRDTADEIGMSFSGLNSFIGGGKPQSKTLFKLVKWFYQRTARSTAPSREEREVAIANIQAYVRDAKSRAVQERRLKEIFDRIKE